MALNEVPPWKHGVRSEAGGVAARVVGKHVIVLIGEEPTGVPGLAEIDNGVWAIG